VERQLAEGPRVLELLAGLQPDLVCMQETRCEDAAFPAIELAAAGYDAVHNSAGRWAGVAILARREPARSATSPSGCPGAARRGALDRGDGRRACASRASTLRTGARSARRRKARRTSSPRSAALGLRIDLALVGDGLGESLVACANARNYRNGSKPSDHAPLVVELG
jgi:exonuclease III